MTTPMWHLKAVTQVSRYIYLSIGRYARVWAVEKQQSKKIAIYITRLAWVLLSTSQILMALLA